MAKAGAKDDLDDIVKDDAPPLGKNDKITLQNAFLDWKRRQASKAQPKKASVGGKAGSKASASGAKPRADDAEAKPTRGPGGSAQAKPPAPYVAEAYKPKTVRTLLDLVVDWYTHDEALAGDLEAWFYSHASSVPPIDMKRVDEGEFPVEAYSLFQAYTAKLEEAVEAFLAAHGGCLADLHDLAKDWDNGDGTAGGGGAYSDAWMFVTLFSACSTFLFFADTLKQAQEGDLKFDTTTGLNPKYAI